MRILRSFSPTVLLGSLVLVATIRASATSSPSSVACAPSQGPVALTTTGKLASASGSVSFKAVTASPAYDASIAVHNLPAASTLGSYSTFVAWVATPALDTVLNVGAIANDRPITTRLTLNRMMFIITAEQDSTLSRFRGAIVLVGRCG